MGQPDGGYDRLAAAQVLARVAGELPAIDHLPPPFEVAVDLTPLAPSPDSHLTPAQLRYVQTALQPCTPADITTATHRLSWQDSTGTPNISHCTPTTSGPAAGAGVAVVAREVVLLLRAALRGDGGVRRRADGLSGFERGVLGGTTTEGDVVEVLAVGFETVARALVQHSWLGGYRSARALALGLQESGIFGVVANTWYWGLQSETYRRGMIPVSFEARADGGVAYTAASRTLLRTMKDAQIAHPEDPGLAKQYGPLAYAEVPRCLANMPVTLNGQRQTLLPAAVGLFVSTFVRMLDVVRITGEETTMSEVFEVPDMTCSHCTNTVSSVLESHGATVDRIDLDSKQVVAAFPSAEVREQAFEAIRDQGYTVVPPAD
ncbi:heavy-metal-associated domain-containing protein [Kribbella sp. GL6]|uniref:heavy-metal-associated domain-containing protein n=1 Tax=Kribbella sp. GL6 TaxID=3419765 RepID=UPI003CFDB471